MACYNGSWRVVRRSAAISAAVSDRHDPKLLPDALDDAGDDGDVNADAEPAETVGAFLAAAQANGDLGSLR